MRLEASFYDAALAVLSGLGATPTAVNVNLVAAWAWCEKPHGAGDAWQWQNPLNTTQPGFGGTCVNSVCVRNYPSRDAGVQATVTTLRNGFYGHLVEALMRADAGEFFSSPGEMATWGTSLGCIQSVYGGLDAPPISSPQPQPPPPEPRPWPPAGPPADAGPGIGPVLLLLAAGLGALAFVEYRRPGTLASLARRAEHEVEELGEHAAAALRQVR